jgi:opacity protein-like surface antigen
MREVRAVVLGLAAFISLATLMSAQDKPLAEITVAYQFNHLTGSAEGETGTITIPFGFDASLNVPITRWFGVVGDVGRVWGLDCTVLYTLPISAGASIWTYGGGGQITYRTPHVQPFARFIIGDAHSSAFASVFGVSAGRSANSFFIAPGAGADFRITQRVWLRAGADYLDTSKDGVSVKGVRASVGITVVFGGGS